jgi:hypothetical protein
MTMKDDEEIGTERDTINSDPPDRDRETSQGARRPSAESTSGASPSKAPGRRRDPPARHPAE